MTSRAGCTEGAFKLQEIIMEKEIMAMVDRIVHIGERHGVASLKMDTKEMQRLADEYSVVKEKIRKLLQPPAQTATAIGTLMHQMQHTKQQLQQQFLKPYPFLQPFEEEEEPEPDTEIEFSL